MYQGLSACQTDTVIPIRQESSTVSKLSLPSMFYLHFHHRTEGRMFRAVTESGFPNDLLAKGGAGDSLEDPKPSQAGLIHKERQPPAVSGEGLGRAPHPLLLLLLLSPLQLPSSNRQVRENDTLHCDVSCGHPVLPEPHRDPPTS